MINRGCTGAHDSTSVENCKGGTVRSVCVLSSSVYDSQRRIRASDSIIHATLCSYQINKRFAKTGTCCDRPHRPNLDRDP